MKNNAGERIKKKTTIVACIAITMILLLFSFCFLLWFIFGGAYLFLSSPPAPEIQSTEIDFELIYELDGIQKSLCDTLCCKFDGYDADEGNGKRRVWKSWYKGEFSKNGDMKTIYHNIILEDLIDSYKIVLDMPSAGYFLGDPDYANTPNEPYVYVQDTHSITSMSLQESQLFFDQFGFKIISWHCDPPIENTFK